MPKKVHRKLVKQANKKGLKGERKKAYVYGTLKKLEKKRGKKMNNQQAIGEAIRFLASNYSGTLKQAVRDIVLVADVGLTVNEPEKMTAKPKAVTAKPKAKAKKSAARKTKNATV